MKDNEPNFEELKQLLKWKRHEIPPPGYFDNFSSQVMAGIRAGQNGDAKSPLNFEASWLARFFRIFETRPGLVGSMATGLVLVLVFGVVITDHSDSDTPGLFTPGVSAQAPSQIVASSTMSPVPATDVASANAQSGGIAVSTNPVTSLQPTPALFGQPNSLFEPASFSTAGGGN